MSVARAVLGSTRGRLALGALVCYLVWQGWLGIAAPGKIAPDLNANAEKVNLLVEVRGVRSSDLRAIARPYWVTRVEPLPKEK